MLDQAAGLRKIAGERRMPVSSLGDRSECRVIAVTSGKGGVGKTNLVVNLAIALRRAGQRVIILDADFGLANVDLFFGITPQYHVGHVLEDNLSLSSIIQENPEGVHIIPASSGLQELTALNNRQRDRILSQLNQVLDAYDFLLIDTAAGISDNVMNFLSVSPSVVVVSVPEPTAILDAYALIKVLTRKSDAQDILLVINSVGNGNEAKRVFDHLDRVTQRFLGRRIQWLGFVLKDDKVSQAVKEQVPLLVGYPNRRVSRCFAHIANALIQGSPYLT